ncbi:tRNA 5-methoxyuridine(34)/uridine 5-oxyacetic acid(34) synthase CmoB [Exilibacterium tricleocarpae]|uniref:tRNA U34 carboxymethyltransferase n=1 Tax=Exilibacterium tricleocarpae TaxID=2591008 RepID=A0A545TM92_9GAMM|nr:tRNA 5-methoxyuridine(34)/uridine 5-oxyacetic acid(34) synthase CmoB [Exilibacterium tricleocarpae]TQV78261.1 tRNA 5-methoxyuridine(34)/uridine 5-oxyacetic acid(34) synthase CmoB [Exilibacterium tricleocarpae]
MIEYYRDLIDALSRAPVAGTPLAAWAEALPAQIAAGLSERRYGDLPQWRRALAQLPAVDASEVDLEHGVSIGASGDCDAATMQNIERQLRALIPWRKGPYQVHGTYIDTEWRSDWKWERLLPHIAPLQGRLVLDVGCGNGYHGWRMLGAGARRVIGIDPSPRFVVQFHCIKHFVGRRPIDVLPLGIEQLPAGLEAFDTVFSMGVLYHRRSPMDHLRELRESLRPGGQLVLETLVIEGGLGTVLVPEGRYAMMNNVWFLPSCETLLSWLRKSGFRNPRVVDVCVTTTAEQRATDWMRFHSLSDFLDPHNPALTAEGHPAPTRALFVAEV